MGFEAYNIDPPPKFMLETWTEVRDDALGILTIFKWQWQGSDEQKLETFFVPLKSIISQGVMFDNESYNYERVREFVNSHMPNFSPQEKLDIVLEYVQSLSKYEGDSVHIKDDEDELAYQLQFRGAKELQFYFDTAYQLNLIERKSAYSSGSINKLTIDGLTRLLQVKAMKASSTCFVAMAFNAEMEIVYQRSIAPAIIESGFEPYIVNRVHMESDQTINDGILVGIKKSRFTIADFTYLKAGVYFEAGYALGRGQKVIYTCRHDFIDKLHFDLRNYQHIVWQDVEDFKSKLLDKIEAFIKE